MRAQINGHEVDSAHEALDQWLELWRRVDWRRIAYYLGVPLVLAFFWFTSDIQAYKDVGVWSTLRFYVAHAFLPWWITCLSTRFVFILMASLRPPAPIVWIAGAVISCFLLIPYMNWMGLMMSATESQPITPGYFLLHAVRVATVWCLVNFLFDRFAGLPRYRYVQEPRVGNRNDAENIASEVALTHGVTEEMVMPISAHFMGQEEPVAELPEFLTKVHGLKSLNELYSISAEEHYVRVHSVGGDELVYKRFSDAVKELEAFPGLRIHRSHWVSPFGVRSVTRENKRMYINLYDGIRLPVSRPYQSMVRSLVERCNNGHESHVGPDVDRAH